MLPLICPAVFAGALFAFTLSLDEFIITLFLIGGHNTLPIYIYTQVKFGITPEVNALASLLLAASLILIAFAFVLPRRRDPAGRGVWCRAASQPSASTRRPNRRSRALATARLEHRARRGGRRRRSGTARAARRRWRGRPLRTGSRNAPP